MQTNYKLLKIKNRKIKKRKEIKNASYVNSEIM